MDDFWKYSKQPLTLTISKKILYIGEVVFSGFQNQMLRLFTVKISYADDLVYADI